MYKAQTNVSFDGTEILINGELTYQRWNSSKRHQQIEGLLFNVRTVNATFDDTLGKVNWWDDDGSQPGWEMEITGFCLCQYRTLYKSPL